MEPFPLVAALLVALVAVPVVTHIAPHLAVRLTRSTVRDRVGRLGLSPLPACDLTVFEERHQFEGRVFIRTAGLVVPSGAAFAVTSVAIRRPADAAIAVLVSVVGVALARGISAHVAARRFPGSTVASEHMPRRWGHYLTTASRVVASANAVVSAVTVVVVTQSATRLPIPSVALAWMTLTTVLALTALAWASLSTPSFATTPSGVIWADVERALTCEALVWWSIFSNVACFLALSILMSTAPAPVLVLLLAGSVALTGLVAAFAIIRGTSASDQAIADRLANA